MDYLRFWGSDQSKPLDPPSAAVEGSVNAQPVDPEFPDFEMVEEYTEKKEAKKDAVRSHSYQNLITQVIELAEDNMTTVNQVYTYSVQKYPFYGKNPSKWKNVIRHWLCLNEDFVKVPYPFGKHDGETFWTLRKYAKKEEELPGKIYKDVDLITMALDKSKEKKLTVGDICKFINDLHPYYRSQNQTRLQESIRHALSFNCCFVTVPLLGKETLWQINKLCVDQKCTNKECPKHIDQFPSYYV